MSPMGSLRRRRGGTITSSLTDGSSSPPSSSSSAAAAPKVDVADAGDISSSAPGGDVSQSQHDRHEPPSRGWHPSPSSPRSVPESSKCSASTAARNLGWFRFVFFHVMWAEWHFSPNQLPPFGSLDLVADEARGKLGKDAWFGYSHLPWIQQLHIVLGSAQNASCGAAEVVECGTLAYLTAIGSFCCIMAAYGLGGRVPSAVFLLLYALRFLSTAVAFANHSYLFLLLMMLMVALGGGRIRRDRTSSEKESPSHPKSDVLDGRLRSESASVALRAQFAVIYLFASLWKLHPDWLSGSIVRAIFLSFEEQGVARGVPWSELERIFPGVFATLAAGGLALDASMFVAYAFVRPRPSTTAAFMIVTLLFHCFTAVTMSLRIGYAFPVVCIAGLLVFLPFRTVPDISGASRSREADVEKKRTSQLMGVGCRTDQGPINKDEGIDASLVSWLLLYLTAPWIESSSKDHERDKPLLPRRWQRLFVLLWVFLQLAIPLRMPIVSRGLFPYTGEGYRWSWTMMLHSRSQEIFQKVTDRDGTTTKEVILNLGYMVPTCESASEPDSYLSHQAYLPGTEDNPAQDSRILPIDMYVPPKEQVMLGYFPGSFLPPVAAGVSKLIGASIGISKFFGTFSSASPKPSCVGQGKDRPNIGIYAMFFGRLNDRGSFSRLIDPSVNLVRTNEAMRQRSAIKKVWGAVIDKLPAGHEVFLRGIGSLRSEAIVEEKRLMALYQGMSVHIIADRASCLAVRPLWLRPMGQKLLAMVLKAPEGREITFRVKDRPADPRNPVPRESSTIKLTPNADAAGNSGTVSSRYVRQGGRMSYQGNQYLFRELYELEIGVDDTDSEPLCKETVEEDVLIALIL